MINTRGKRFRGGSKGRYRKTRFWRKKKIVLRKLIAEDIQHIPVFATEVSQYIVTKRNGIYIDATFGGGGHSQIVLDLLDEDGRLIAFDLDDDAIKRGKELEAKDSRFKIVKMNFADIEKYLNENGIGKVDGIVFDLGLSTFQLASRSRGFSYSFDDAYLDMRMDRDESNIRTAEALLSNGSREQLTQIFKRYGDIRNPSKLVNNISLHRKKYGTISKVGDFVHIVDISWDGRVDFQRFLSQCFQALRIAVNRELESLDQALDALSRVVNKKGMVAIATFHSLEEQRVRNWQQRYCQDICIQDYGNNVLNQFSFVSTRCILPSMMEKDENWSSRSSKLWLVQKN